MWSALLLACLSFIHGSLSDARDGTGCPNQAFKLVAGYRQSFHLNTPDGRTPGRFWVAFGGNGKWSVELVDSMWNGKKQTFKCKENYFDAVAAIDGKKENAQERKERQPICCAAPHDIDAYVTTRQATSKQAPKAKPFAVLPQEMFFALSKSVKINAKPQKKPYGASSPDKFYWMQGPTSPSNHGHFYRWRRVKINQANYESKTFEKLSTSGVVFNDLEKAEDQVPMCISSDAYQCDTGIASDIVVFEIHCKLLSHIRFGFSSTGIFDMSFFRCLDGTKHDSEVYYYPVTKLFTHSTPPSYNSLRLGWKLGAFCASCPSIMMKMTITESQARKNRHRLQNAVTMHVKATVEARYTRSWFHEAGETLTSGKATTISAICNGFYLWYWTVSVGTWGEGDIVIPTQLFYCTDRNEEPVCKPRIAGMKDTDGFGKLCNGHDVEADFKQDSGDLSKPWQSFHDGRPKPVRLQGQRGVEPDFKLMQVSRAAADTGYETYMKDKDTPSKGLFVASAMIDDDNALVDDYDDYDDDDDLDDEDDEEIASAMDGIDSSGGYDWELYTVVVAFMCGTGLAGCCCGLIVACAYRMLIGFNVDKNIMLR